MSKKSTLKINMKRVDMLLTDMSNNLQREQDILEELLYLFTKHQEALLKLQQELEDDLQGK